MRNVVYVFLVMLLSFTLVACQSSDETSTKQEEIKKEEKLNKKFDISETLKFDQFDVEFKNAKAYEKDGKLLLDLKFDWRNKGLPDGSTLFVATFLEVVQNDKELEEINDHWNPEGDRSLQNDVFLNNAAGGLSPVKLTYELDNKEDKVELIFTPTTETEDSQVITIELN